MGQRLAAAQPLSTTTTSGCVIAAVAADCGLMTGPASAAITAAATTIRKSVSHHGLRIGVFSFAFSPSRSEAGGNETVSGRGGVSRRNSQITGKAASPASIQG